MNKPACSAAAFTLLELLTVMAIILILTALLVGVSSVVSRNMSEAKTKARLESMMLALQECFQDRGYFPQAAQVPNSDTTWADFVIANPADFKSTQTGRPYLESYSGGVYKDAWDRPFQYTTSASVALGGTPTASETGYWLRSKGPDKTAGTEDDICSWKQH